MIARVSNPLSALTKGEMKEALDKRAELKHIDPKTFAAVLEFAYTGKYSTTTCSALHKGHSPFKFQNISREETDSRLWRWVWLGNHSLHCCVCGTEVSLWSLGACTMGCTAFCRAAFTRYRGRIDEYCAFCGDQVFQASECEHCAVLLTHPPDDMESAMAKFLDCDACVHAYPRSDTDDNCDQQLQKDDESFPIFQTLNDILHHCKVYVFADMYGIDNLQSWALCWVWLNLFRVRDRMKHREAYEFHAFADIVKYVMSNTRSTSGFIHGAVQADNLSRLITNFSILE